MPRKPPLDLTQPLVPHFFYPKSGAVAKGVIGLKSDSQIQAKIDSGELKPPIAAFEDGRRVGWMGSYLIELQQQRLARAAEAVEAKAKRAAKTEPVELARARKRRTKAAGQEATT